jgi:hypothetical protein
MHHHYYARSSGGRDLFTLWSSRDWAIFQRSIQVIVLWLKTSCVVSVSSSCSNYQNNIMPAVRSTTAAKFKASEARGKAKAPVASTSAIGAPAQYKQTNRKGKKAWRKNIDIQSEEQALEKVREIEQALGYVAFFTYREP